MIDATGASLRQRLKDTAAEAMLAAAERIMMEKGFEKATMQEVANGAGCAIGTLYVYYKNKGELFQAMVQRRVAGLRQEMREQSAKVSDPLEKLRTRTWVYLAWVQQNLTFVNVFCAAMPMRYYDYQEQMKALAPEAHATYFQEQLGLIREAQAAGLLRRDFSAEALTEMYEGILLTMTDQFSAKPEKYSLEEQMRLLWGMLMHGMT